MQKLNSLSSQTLYFYISILVLIFAVLFGVVLFSIFGFGNVVNQTTVGFIYLGNTPREQYSTVLTQQVTQWKNSATYEITFQDYAYEVDLSLFDFQVSQTVSNIIEDERNPALFTISDANKLVLLQDLSEHFGTTIGNGVVINNLTTRLITDFRLLYSEKTYSLNTYIDPTLAENVIADTTIDDVALSDVGAILSTVTTLTIHPLSRFSVLDELGDTVLTNEQMSIIASGLQDLSKSTPFNGFVFDQNLTMPAWAEPGKNVRILEVSEFDYSFYNPLDYELTVNISSNATDEVTLALVGFPFITTYVTVAETQIVIPFTTVYEYDDTINELTTDVIITDTVSETIYQLLIQSGVDGGILFYQRTGTLLDGTQSTTRIFTEQYALVPEIYRENRVAKVGP